MLYYSYKNYSQQDITFTKGVTGTSHSTIIKINAGTGIIISCTSNLVFGTNINCAAILITIINIINLHTTYSIANLHNILLFDIIFYEN
jgi:hypothetical protein